jgi:NAD(P)-dependent dehydrogenase (short-subunit alcohol dehydrogenase family)
LTADPLFDLSDRAALAAGGASGLGAALARALAERGARVTVADLDADKAAALAAALPGSDHDACALDVRDEASCAAAVDRLVARAGRLDLVLNSVGIWRTAPALELAREDFAATLETNVTGAFLLARAAAKAMAPRGGGRIVTIASVSSQVVNPGYAAYATSKAALAHLTRVLALEWAPLGITVNAVGPAMTPTPLTAASLAEGEVRDRALSRIPMGRLGRPEDLIGTVLLLASPAGAFITGQTLYVDGGRTIA